MNPELSLHDPWWLLALGMLPALVWLRRWRPARVFLIPYVASWQQAPARVAGVVAWLAIGVGLALVIVSLARPQRNYRRLLPPTEGCDVMLAVDVSGSPFEARTIQVCEELYVWLAIPGLVLLLAGSAAGRVPWHRWVTA